MLHSSLLRFLTLFLSFLTVTFSSLAHAESASSWEKLLGQKSQAATGGTIPLTLLKPEGAIENTDPLIIRLCDPSSRIKNYCRSPERTIGTSGKKLDTVTLSPAIEGEWRMGENQLVFQPKKPWPASQRYEVTPTSGTLPAYVQLDRSTLTFTTTPFHAHFRRLHYMQDPSDVSKKLVSGTISFNYPINKKSLESHLKIQIEHENLPFSAVLNEEKTEANIEIPIATLTEKEKVIEAEILEGLETEDGKGQLLKKHNGPDKGKLYETAILPSLYSYLDIQSAQVEVVKNSSYVPEQLLIVQANIPLIPSHLLENLEIYLLPKDKSVPGASPIRNYAWSSSAEITPEILAQSEKVTASLPQTARDSAPLISVKLETAENRHLLIRIKKNMLAEGGFKLKSDYATIAKTPRRTEEVKIMSEGALLSLSGEKTISIVSLGVKKLAFDIARIDPSNINHLVSQTGGHFQNPLFFQEYTFNEHNIAEMLHEERALQVKSDKAPVFTGFDFSPYLEKSFFRNKQGLFLLTVRGQNENAHLRGEDRRLILVTDMGILLKTHQDKTSDVFVMSIANGKPIGGAEVNVIGLNGKPVFSTKIDGDGRAALPNLSGFSQEKRPVAVVVRKGIDLTFMPYDRRDREVNTSRFDVEGVRNSSEGLKAYLFSDRGIYRPGETFSIGMMVKDAAWKPEIEGLPLKLEVMNSRGQIIDTKQMPLTKDGFMEYSFKTEDTSATGTYNVSLYIAKDGNNTGLLGSTTIRVEEFLPDKMKISSEFSKKPEGGWVSPDDITATITLEHLFGGAAENRRVTAHLTLLPGEFAFPAFKEYQFLSDSTLQKSEEVKLEEAVTDAAGKAAFPLPLKQFGASTYKLTFFAEGFEPDSGRSVKTAKTMLVSSRPYVVGTKPDGPLTYVHAGEERKVHFIALNSTLKPVATEALRLDTIRIDQVSSLTRRSNGSFSYESKAVEKRINTDIVTIAEKGTFFSLPTKEPGDYALQLKDEKGLILARVPFTVAGEGNISASLNRDASLKVTLNKASYAAGEEIELSVISPYTGAGLITIETDKVHTFTWFKTKTTSSTHTIKIPEDFEGKGFVSVQFVRSLDSHEIYMSPFTYAVQPFVSNIDQHDQKISLNVPSLTRPGADLTIGYKTAHKGKIIVYAVDEGILLFGRYKTPDPLQYFLGSRALEVETSQIFDLLLPEYSILKSLSAAGGDGWVNDGKNMNPFKRKTLPPVAFWSGVLESDTKEKQVHFTVPDYFNGGLRVMAVAVSEGAMGATEASTSVKGHVVITPNLPLFASPGDSFEVPVTLMNAIKGSGEKAEIPFKVTPSEHLTLVEPLPASISVPYGKEKTLRLRFKATEVLGSGSVTFEAGRGEHSSYTTSTLSIRPLAPAVFDTKSGYAKKGAPGFTKNVTLTRTLYPDMFKGTASVSSLPESVTLGLARYVNTYPYGCAEQVASKTFANILLYKMPGSENTPSLQSEALYAAIKEGFRHLRELQNDTGGFSMWSYYGENDDLVTVYIAHMLTEAKAKGLPVPDNMRERALAYVKSIAGRMPESLTDARTKAYGLYVITRNGEVTANYLPNLIRYLEQYEKDSWKQDATALYIAASYQMMQLVPEAEKLLSEYKPATTYLYSYHFYDSLVADALYLSLVSRHFKDHALDNNTLFRVIHYIEEQQYNTFSSLHAILGLLEYSAAQKTGTLSTITVNEDGKALPLTGERIKQAPLQPGAKNIGFTSPQGEAFFYQIDTYGFDKNVPTTAVADGIELTKRYLDQEGKELTETTLGTEIIVELRLRAGSNDSLPNIAVVDLLPAGFEIAEKPFAKEEFTENLWRPGYTSKREDRMIAFGTFDPVEQLFRYKIKAVNRGSFTTPPAYAEAMYQPRIKARGVGGHIEVK